MKKLFSIIPVFLTLLVVGCTKPYDDSEIRADIADLQERVEALEEMCREMNTNISALQTIVSALQNNDYITGVTPITENGVIIGYTITFAKSAPITIYHGEDGQDGYIPQIGVKKDSDGIYYWTLDGEWMLDSNGNKIETQGPAGVDGITPKLKIENGYWFVSYDNGKTWTQLGQATGDKGEQGDKGDKGDTGLVGDSMFTDVDYSNEDYVIFTLSNGTQVKVPTWYVFEQLQTLCNQMNTNITALQTIVSALQNNDYVTSVVPVVENGKTIGYTINFTKSNPVTIYHGEKGQDGHSPIVGVKQDTDGLYYWTIDGEWLTDAEGNKIKAIGIDGADAVAPQLKIEGEYWYISTDGGQSWTKLEKAVGKDGKDGDAFFQGVSQDEQFVHFTLADGTVITLPKGASLDITFDVSDLVVMHPNTTREIAYTVQSVTTNVVVEVTSSADIKAKVISSDASGKSGVIKITTSAVVDEYSKVIVFVGNGEKVVMKSIAFEQSGLEISNNATQNIAAAGGNIALNFLSNMEWQVEIPTEAQSWISFAPSTRAMTAHSVSLAVLPNTSLYERSADVKVVTLDGKLSVTYTISQGIFNSFTATASSAWQEGDKMSVFAGNNKNQQFNYNGANGLFEAAATYSGTPAATSVHYAVYPYSSTYSLESDGKILVNLPSEQSYVANGFKREYNAMVAVSSGLDDTNFVMRPICAYICVKLWGNDQTVKSLTLSTTAGEQIAGKALVTPSVSAAATCVVAGSATSIKLNCSNEVTIGSTESSATEFWFVVPAVALSQGYTIKVVGFYGGEQAITVADPITLESGATYTTTHELTISTNGPGIGVGGWENGEDVGGEI